jgi:hypothetical protein
VANRQQHVVEWIFDPVVGGSSFIFNSQANPPASSGVDRLFTTDRPTIRLTIAHEAQRHATQTSRLAEVVARIKDSDAALGQLSDWRKVAATIYDTYLLSRPSGAAQQRVLLPLLGMSKQRSLLGVIPEQPLSQSNPHDTTPRPTEPWTDLTLRKLCLFNIIIACEWWPISSAYERQFAWAFRRMSDFLFDVTDGYMALGTVVIGGPDWLSCADIQVLASNRLHPRSWVSGMQIAHKYMPIRVGRGFWSKRTRRATLWDEPEGYRTLTHEWAHYALGLKDHYLVRVGVDLRLGKLLESQQASPEAWLALPTISLPLESIMSTLDGTSELVDNAGGDGKSDEWSELKNRFPDLDIHITDLRDQGPGNVPLPLPEIAFIDLPAAVNHPVNEGRFDAPIYVKPQLAAAPSIDINSYPAVIDSHCWVYTIRGALDNPQSMIAHGVLDARAGSDGFQLLGAEQGDMIVLIADGYATQPKDGRAAQPIVLTGSLAAPNTDGKFNVAGWRNSTPDSFPIVDVYPVGNYDPNNGYSLRVALDAGGWRGWLFPLEGIEQITPAHQLSWMIGATASDQSIAGKQSDLKSTIATLDGHVLLTSGGTTPALMTIAAYSIGGGPQTINPPYTNPIPAGSSEGNALLFFYDAQGSVPMPDDAEVPLVITTRNYGTPLLDPALEPRSYTFSLAANMALPDDREATLVMFVDRDTANDTSVLELHRYTGGSHPWSQIPALYKKDLSLVAAPLYNASARINHSPAPEVPPATAPGLIAHPLVAERYRLVARQESSSESS